MNTQVMGQHSLFACRLIVDEPAAGSWNMAVDQVLLESAARDGITTLRFYRWLPATLSLGYFQRAADRSLHTASLACPMVRRASGGGAIVHDRELTYSLALPKTHQLAADTQSLYQAVHRSLIETLAAFGIVAKLHAASPIESKTSNVEPFLCFQRRAAGDVLVGLDKVAGSAQRRLDGAVLQHGSILLKRSEFAPELPGISDLAGLDLSERELADTWQAPLARAISAAPFECRITEDEQSAARQIVAQRFAAESWTNRR